MVHFSAHLLEAVRTNKIKPIESPDLLKNYQGVTEEHKLCELEAFCDVFSAHYRKRIRYYVITKTGEMLQITPVICDGTASGLANNFIKDVQKEDQNTNNARASIGEFFKRRSDRVPIEHIIFPQGRPETARKMRKTEKRFRSYLEKNNSVNETSCLAQKTLHQTLINVPLPHHKANTKLPL